MVNIKDVAKETHYSISTISKAFSNSTDISEETRKIIIETAKKMGYEFKNNKKKNKGSILVLTKDIDAYDTNKFGYELVFGFTVAAYNAGYQVVVESDSKDNLNITYDERIAKGNYIGGFLIGYTSEELIKMDVQNTKIHTVALDNIINNPLVSCVGSDNERGLVMAVEHLTKLGHKKIAMISGERDSYVAKVRKRAFSLVMQNMNLDSSNDLGVYSNFLENQVDKFIPHFLEKNVTAIVCASDLIAYNVCDYLTKNNIKIPEDVSVIGYDNAPIATQCKPNLTTIDQSSSDIGKTALFVLLQSIEGVNISKLLIRPKLIVRDSTAKAKN